MHGNDRDAAHGSLTEALDLADPKALHRTVLGAFASGEWTRIQPFVSDDHVLHQSLLPPVAPRGWPPLLEVLKFFAHGLKGVEIHAAQQIATADRVVSRFEGHATHAGEFGIVRPSGREVVVTGMLESRYERVAGADGAETIRALESWLEVNALEIALLVGAVRWQDPVRRVNS